MAGCTAGWRYGRQPWRAPRSPRSRRWRGPNRAKAAGSDQMTQSLLGTRRFAPLFWCQLFSAFNDNYLKNALVLLILFEVGEQTGEALVSLAGAIFMAPFFLLSAFGGELADRFDKALVAR